MIWPADKQRGVHPRPAEGQLEEEFAKLMRQLEFDDCSRGKPHTGDPGKKMPARVSRASERDGENEQRVEACPQMPQALSLTLRRQDSKSDFVERAALCPLRCLPCVQAAG
jgi:hypothetical protein